jgi:hypothetical protein
MAAITNWQGFERDKNAERLMQLHEEYWQASAREVERAAEALSPVQENAAYAQNLGLGRQGAPGANQLSRADLRNMSHQEIRQARTDGLLDNLMKGI